MEDDGWSTSYTRGANVDCRVGGKVNVVVTVYQRYTLRYKPLSKLLVSPSISPKVLPHNPLFRSLDYSSYEDCSRDSVALRLWRNDVRFLEIVVPRTFHICNKRRETLSALQVSLYRISSFQSPEAFALEGDCQGLHFGGSRRKECYCLGEPPAL